MMAAIRLFSILALLLSLPLLAHASMKEVDAALRSGDKAKAWNLLYEMARAGNTQAMFTMAQLLESSPEIPDNKDKALLYYTAAAERGHKQARTMVHQHKRQKQLQVTGPSQQEIQAAIRENERRYKEMAAAAKDPFVKADGTTAQYKVDVFVTEASQLLQEVINVRNSVQRDDVIWNFHLVLDDSVIGNTQHLFQLLTTPPKEGFIPDIDGSEAARLGISTFPAISISDSSGQRLIDLRNLKSLFGL